MAILKENWKDLIKPTSLNLKSKNRETEAKVEIEPLERGYAITIGNALRRVLLSSIRGFAVTSIKIEGVEHEYSSIKGVKEDVVDIILSIKALIIKKDSPSSAKMTLSVSQEGPVYAKDIQTDNGVEILNPDMYICTVEKGGSINMDLKVELGMGYVPADMQDRKDSPIGTIFVDALHSPVKKVFYEVENVRVDKRTDYDKLVLNIETDGTITPEEAVGLAAKILQEQLEVFVSFEVEEEDDKLGFYDSFDADPNLFKSIEELELSVRSYNCLKNENIKYVGDLVIRTESEMLKTSNFGRKSLNELKENLKEMGLSFGMNIPNWPPENVAELSLKVCKNNY